MIEQINHIASLWFSGALAMFWQVGVLIILIGCVDLIIRKWAWPQLRYALWLMVLLKLILPPTISLSTSVTSGLQPLARQIVEKEIHRENLNSTTAMILANLEDAVVEPPVETVSSGDTVIEQPVPVFASPENTAGVSLNAASVKPTWQAYVMAIWLSGMLILVSWLIIKLLNLRKEDLLPASTASLPESFYDSLTRCAERLGLRRIPKVVLTRRVACPAVFGMFRPVLLMPVGYLSKMTRRDTENMLLHELAHIKRGDLWVHGFYMLLQIVYWYNPLLWLVRGQMHHLRELCCDATVARLLKERIIEYRQTLIDVARRFLTKPTEPGLGLLGLFEDSNRLLVRLNWLKKDTWRYQKMKKLTIITTITLMLAFVLPMAQAQDKPATEAGSTETVKAEEQTSQSENTAEIEQTQKQYQQQLSQNLRELEVRLQQLQIQKQKLEQEIQAMVQAKQAEVQARQVEVRVRHAEIQAAQAKIKAKEAEIKAKEAKDKAEKVSEEAEKVKDKAEKAKASVEARAKEVLITSEFIDSDLATEVLPALSAITDISIIPDETVKGLITCELKEVPLETALGIILAGTPYTYKKTKYYYLICPRKINVAKSPIVDVTSVPAKQPRSFILGPTGNIDINKDKDGKYVANTEIKVVLKTAPSKQFVVRNKLGNIILQASKDSTCDVRAIIRAKAKKAAEAQEVIEHVGMYVDSSEERYYLRPVKSEGDKWNNLSVDLYIAVPPGIRPDVKTDLGSIEISNLKGNVKAITNLGSIKAVNTTGNIELFTKMGAIEFIALKNLSAKLQAQTKMGEIESELPLEVKKLDMFKRTAQGTIGTGQVNIKMATDMGGINLKWQPTQQDETKL